MRRHPIRRRNGGIGPSNVARNRPHPIDAFVLQQFQKAGLRPNIRSLRIVSRPFQSAIAKQIFWWWSQMPPMPSSFQRYAFERA